MMMVKVVRMEGRSVVFMVRMMMVVMLVKVVMVIVMVRMVAVG